MESIEELRAQLFEAHEQIHSLQQKYGIDVKSELSLLIILRFRLNVECTAVRKQLEFERDELRLQLKERLPRTRHDNSKLKQERDVSGARTVPVKGTDAACCPI